MVRHRLPTAHMAGALWLASVATVLLSARIDAGARDAVEPPPPMVEERELDEAPIRPPRIENDDFEPEIRIIRREHVTIEEYRHNGDVYMVKVTPRYGPPYYLVDTSGDGRLDARHTEIGRGFTIPRWILFEW